MPLSASASVRAGQVFIRGGELSKVADRVTAYLEGLGDSATEGQAERQLLLVDRVPGKGRGKGAAGWQLLLDSTPEGVDPHLARALAREEGLEVLRLEVDGASLSWQRAASRDGALPDPVREPEAGYGAGKIEGPLPLYKDVELAAWRFLASHRVEAALRLVSLESLEVVPVDRKGGREAIAFRLLQGKALERKATRVKIPPASKAPPTAADAALPDGMGEPGQTIDLIRLTGEVKPARVNQLVKVLLSIQRRHRATDPRPFCHLVEAPYLLPVYQRLAAREGPCRAVYRTLLARAKKSAKEAEKHPPSLRPSLRPGPLPEAH